MPDTYFNTATTNFDKTVVPQVLKRVQKTLRGGLSFTPRGSFIPAQHVSGGSGVFRAFQYGDIDNSSAVANMGDADADPSLVDLSADYIEFTATRQGAGVGLTDNARKLSPHNMLTVASEKVARSIAEHMDDKARTVYAAATPALFGGTGNTLLRELDAADVLTASLVKDAVATLRSLDVPALDNGLYAFVADSLAIRDLQDDEEYINEVSYAKPEAFLTGQIATYAGAAIIDAGSRGIVTVDGATTLIAAGATTVEADDDIFTTASAHGLSAGDRVRIVSMTGGTGATVGTIYFVIAGSLTATTFKLSATAGGASLAITADGSAITFGRPRDAHIAAVIGADSVFGALGDVEVNINTGADKSDPWNRRDSVTWKAFTGAVKNDLQDIERFLTIGVATRLTG